MEQLDLFTSNFPQSENLMTTKQLAEVLHVDERTIRGTAQRLGLSEGTFRNPKGGRPSKIFNEKQATIIKQEIQKHHNLASRQIDSITTEEEENQTIINALSILKRRADEYKQRAEIAESKVIEMQPDADFGKVVQLDEDTYFSMDKVVDHLKLSYGRNTLMFNLRFLKILKEDNQPYEQYKSQGIVSFIKINGQRNFNVPHANAKGEKFILKKLKEFNLLGGKAV